MPQDKQALFDRQKETLDLFLERGAITPAQYNKSVSDLIVKMNIDLKAIGAVEVVAALIWDADRFMICQRPAHKARGLLWEFVGGKVEAGETKEQALVRECREELGVTVSADGVFMDLIHAYPDLTVHLTLFHARITEGAVQRLEHADIRFITPGEIDDYAFCPADEDILRRIRATYMS